MARKSKSLDVQTILKELRSNKDKLDSCDAHNFGTVKVNRKGIIGKTKVACTKCGGVMQYREIVIYQDGFKAAGGDINNVIQFGYKDD